MLGLFDIRNRVYNLSEKLSEYAPTYLTSDKVLNTSLNTTEQLLQYLPFSSARQVVVEKVKESSLGKAVETMAQEVYTHYDPDAAHRFFNNRQGKGTKERQHSSGIAEVLLEMEKEKMVVKRESTAQIGSDDILVVERMEKMEKAREDREGESRAQEVARNEVEVLKFADLCEDQPITQTKREKENRHIRHRTRTQSGSEERKKVIQHTSNASEISQAQVVDKRVIRKRQVNQLLSLLLFSSFLAFLLWSCFVPYIEEVVYRHRAQQEWDVVAQLEVRLWVEKHSGGSLTRLTQAARLRNLAEQLPLRVLITDYSFARSCSNLSNSFFHQNRASATGNFETQSESALGAQCYPTLASRNQAEAATQEKVSALQRAIKKELAVFLKPSQQLVPPNTELAHVYVAFDRHHLSTQQPAPTVLSPLQTSDPQMPPLPQMKQKNPVPVHHTSPTHLGDLPHFDLVFSHLQPKQPSLVTLFLQSVQRIAPGISLSLGNQSTTWFQQWLKHSQLGALARSKRNSSLFYQQHLNAYFQSPASLLTPLESLVDVTKPEGKLVITTTQSRPPPRFLLRTMVQHLKHTIKESHLIHSALVNGGVPEGLVKFIKDWEQPIMHFIKTRRNVRSPSHGQSRTSHPRGAAHTLQLKAAIDLWHMDAVDMKVVEQDTLWVYRATKPQLPRQQESILPKLSDYKQASIVRTTLAKIWASITGLFGQA
jgi:hypothetical protein